MCLSTLNLTLPRSFKFHSKDDGPGEVSWVNFGWVQWNLDLTKFYITKSLTNDFANSFTPVIV